MAARVLVLAAWLLAASVPPSSAATTGHGGVVGAEHAGGQRGAGRHTDHAVDDVPQRVQARDLVGKKLDEQQRAAGRQHPPGAAAPASPRATESSPPAPWNRRGRPPRRGGKPLAQPSAAASASRLVMSSWLAAALTPSATWPPICAPASAACCPAWAPKPLSHSTKLFQIASMPCPPEGKGPDYPRQPGGFALLQKRRHTLAAFVTRADVGKCLPPSRRSARRRWCVRPRPAPGACRRARRPGWH